ncbi:unnamed protein product [Musa banksii]
MAAPNIDMIAALLRSCPLMRGPAAAAPRRGDRRERWGNHGGAELRHRPPVPLGAVP